ncbi:membrane protein ORF147B [Cyprinid herpesvirus 1]|uniref:Membrane protein ORF147B n=1 Tax=Cyprinid herpesvirus 1 TaxID=317858 RepID=K7PBM8_9VIRU|nr:membrane protein ORF147B [Cyprinid herpesvirus 1]AFJ20436.1 membrane protein ORF147B [Cyprinid herpesvirus 1]
MSPVGVLFFALAAASYIPSCSTAPKTTKFNVHCPKVGRTPASTKPVTFEKNLMTGWGVAKDAACAACGVTPTCSSYKLFKGDDKKNDGSVIGKFEIKAVYSLKLYTSTDKKNIKYICNNKLTPTTTEEDPTAEVDADQEDQQGKKTPVKPAPEVKPSIEVKTASCALSETLKVCFKRDGCDGEVYDGSRKTSSTKVAAASTSTVYEVKPSFSFFKKLFTKATSAETKAAVKKAVDKVITNKETIEEIARLMNIPETTIKEITKIIKVGDRVYARDVKGALTLIVGKDTAVTEAETDVLDILEDVDETVAITESELTSLTELERHRHSASVLSEDNFKIIVIGAGAGGGALVLLICCGGCVACCFCCKKKNKKSKEKVQVIYTGPAPPTAAVEMQTMEPPKMFSQPPVYQETAIPV